MTKMNDKADLANFLVAEAVVLHMNAENSEEVIRFLAAKLADVSHVRPSFADAVLAREKNMPTGLPLGLDANVAIPHTDPEHVLKAGLALATLEKPVLFANMEEPEEKIPVGTVFLLAINDKDKQIDVLQKIMALIQDKAALEALRAAGTVDDVKNIFIVSAHENRQG